MKAMALRMLFAAIALAGLPASALAAPLMWTMSGVTFSDGGTASGSFVYDASTNTNSAVNITTTTGATVTGATYTFICTGACDSGLANSPNYLVALNVPNSTSPLTGTPLLELFFATSLTNVGGTVILSTGGASFEDRCSAANCSTTQPPFRTVTAGSIIAGPVGPSIPVPTPTLSNWALIMLAMLVAGAIAFSRRRRSGS